MGRRSKATAASAGQQTIAILFKKHTVPVTETDTPETVAAAVPGAPHADAQADVPAEAEAEAAGADGQDHMPEDGDAGAGDDDLAPDGKKTKKRNYLPAWQQEFGRWLIGMAKDSKPDSPVMAFCQACGAFMDNKKHTIRKHSTAATHVEWGQQQPRRALQQQQQQRLGRQMSSRCRSWSRPCWCLIFFWRQVMHLVTGFGYMLWQVIGNPGVRVPHPIG
jgi:hypothetical protein